MKSRSGSSGYLNTMTSPRLIVPIGSSARSSARGARPEHELVDQQMIADEQVVLHRAGRNLERLHDERADEQRQDDGDDDRFEVFADGRFLKARGGRIRGARRRRLASFVIRCRFPSSAPRETLPAGSRPCRRASSASCLPSASRAACACARCRRRSTSRARSSASPSPIRAR